MRRSPLIDALHPAVAKHRAFRLTLRKTVESDVSPPMATKENKAVHTSQETRSIKHQNVAEACGPANRSVVGKISTRRGKRIPLSVAPPSFSPSPVGQHSRPSPLPPAPQPSVGVESGAGNEPASADTAAPAVRLTVEQCRCADDWVEKVKYSLGLKVWDCLGSSPAFYRIRDRFRRYVVPAGACRTGNESGRPLGHASPLRGGESERKLTKTSEARDEGVIFGPTSRKDKGHKLETENKDGDISDWGDSLSQKAAFVVGAIMWAIATERERSNVCATILQDRKARSERPSISALEAGHAEGKGNAESPPTNTALAVSWPRARRFVKSSRLVDGVNVVDADVDLAFKRWEESEQAGRPVLATTTNRSCSPSRSGPEPSPPGFCTAVNAARIRSRDVAAVPRLCDAVGCSEGGRYGDICPIEKTRFCRKHRKDGMVDLGGRR